MLGTGKTTTTPKPKKKVSDPKKKVTKEPEPRKKPKEGLDRLKHPATPRSVKIDDNFRLKEVVVTVAGENLVLDGDLLKQGTPFKNTKGDKISQTPDYSVQLEKAIEKKIAELVDAFFKATKSWDISKPEASLTNLSEKLQSVKALSNY